VAGLWELSILTLLKNSVILALANKKAAVLDGGLGEVGDI
jgi:hypothetical protein